MKMREGHGKGGESSESVIIFMRQVKR